MLTSEYVYLPKRGKELCHTSNFQWEQNVDVTLIITGKLNLNYTICLITIVVKNLGRWIDHLIQNIETVSYC